MAEEELRLESFEADDFEDLIAVVPDAAFVLRWAGPDYEFPLDARQLAETLAKTAAPVATFALFKAVAGSGETVGHVQLMDIDRERSTCVLGRVLIFPGRRGEGLGKRMVAAALDQAFSGLGLDEVTLHVFAFNRPALATYEGAGFVRLLPDPEPHPFGEEIWPVRHMALSRERWAERRATPPGGAGPDRPGRL